MIIHEKMRLNKFQQVSIPKPSDMFARLGLRETPANQYSGEEEMLGDMNKVEQLGAQMKMYEQYAEQAEIEAKKKASKQAEENGE